ncbi:MAG: hypothetical protein HC887_11260 [Desulfobacteraceae bacterium]|nr:hypothetical protein [Desulfobacteraceae bacterium]
MISVTDLEQVAKDRLEDSFTLAVYGRYDGSVYLCGYALEIALKVRICKSNGRSDFPENTHEFKSHGLKDWRTHDLRKLLRLSGLEPIFRTDRIYSEKFSYISDKWDVDYRYKRSIADELAAFDMIEANQILLEVIL